MLSHLRRSSLKERSKSSVEVLRRHDFHRAVVPTHPPVEDELLFHQHWWLDAVAGSQWQEVTVAGFLDMAKAMRAAYEYEGVPAWTDKPTRVTGNGGRSSRPKFR